MKNHHYEIKIKWTGNLGVGTQDYRSYSRNHAISADGKYAEILASSDPAFLGDKVRYNPEELLLSSLSACHMLWYLHLCAESGVVVVDYTDNAIGTMEESKDGGGRFTKVTLHPIVVVAENRQIETANRLHEKAHKLCFIANSCNFPIGNVPTTTAQQHRPA